MLSMLTFPPHRFYRRWVVSNSEKIAGLLTGLFSGRCAWCHCCRISAWQISTDNPVQSFCTPGDVQWARTYPICVSRSLGFQRQYFWNGVPLGPWITHLNAVTTWCVVHRAHRSSMKAPCICSLHANKTKHFILKLWYMCVWPSLTNVTLYIYIYGLTPHIDKWN